MRFAIRDDDVNYHFSVKFLADCLNGITEVCPITLAVVPWFKGNWREKLSLLERLGAEGINEGVIAKIKSDDKIYRLGDNIALLRYLNSEIECGRVSIAQHGIYHINEDTITPTFNKNFGIGAEFFTERELTCTLKKSNAYLKDLFHESINCFTPPQNLISEKGYEALASSEMNVCAYLPSVKQYGIYNKYFSFFEYVKIFKHKLVHRNTRRPYPKAVRFGDKKFIEHVSLQPNSSIEEIKDAIDFVANENGDFVLSTHTYAFSQKMSCGDKTMKEVLLDLVRYAKEKYNVRFVDLDEILR